MDVTWKNTNVCQVGLYFCINLAVHNFSTPLVMELFLHAQVKNPCHIPLFLYLLSYHHLCFLCRFLPLSVSCLTSHQKVLHILYLSAVTFCTLPLLPLQTSSSPHLHLKLCCTPPPPLSFFSSLSIFFLLTPTHS